MDKLITLAVVLGIQGAADMERDELFSKIKAIMEARAARAARAAEVPTKAPSIIERVGAREPWCSLEKLPTRESKRAARRARGRSKGARG